jgi:hypothetical protein
VNNLQSSSPAHEAEPGVGMRTTRLKCSLCGLTQEKRFRVGREEVGLDEYGRWCWPKRPIGRDRNT